jgi:3-oxoisoapionate decarboxylase
MTLGISSYTFGWAVGVAGYPPDRPLDESDLLQKALEHRVKLLQIGDNLPLHTFDSARLGTLASRARQEGVTLEVGARRLTVGRVAEYAAIARRLGASLIRFVIDDRDYHPTPAAITGILREVAGTLEGLTLGIENHDRFQAETLRQIIEDAGSERIGVCLDTANSLGAGEGIVAVASLLAPLTVNLHIKDFHIERVSHGMGFQVSGRAAGHGMLELSPLLQKLGAFNRCRTAVLELWTPPERELQATINKERLWAAQSIDFLRNFFP